MQIVKKNNLLFIIFILLIVQNYSCESTQKQLKERDILNIDLYLRYLQPEKQVKAAISFSKIDSTDKIMPKRMETVLFQGNVLDGKKKLNDYRYQITENVPFTEEYYFEYRHNGQNLAKEIIKINAITDFRIKKEKISKTIGTTINVQGANLEHNESLIVLLSDENNKTASLKFNDLTINILPEQVSNLAAGKGTIYIVRKHLIEKQSTDRQLTAMTEFFTVVKTIEILE